ncbi:FH1/FH2 domain-containing protein 1 [Varanus komodoensis]|nr:FH1/FH2 domain-containing protein 1 [Varanus komodoensis]
MLHGGGHRAPPGAMLRSSLPWGTASWGSPRAGGCLIASGAVVGLGSRGRSAGLPSLLPACSGLGARLSRVFSSPWCLLASLWIPACALVLQLEDCAVQVLPSGHYLDLELSLLEQKDELEGHQEDKDLVPEFVSLEGLTCLITVGAEADQNYQNYILRALGQIMLFVDGMTGYRLVVKMALKLLLVFVEYAESNAQLLIQAVLTEEQARGRLPWSRLMALLEQKNGADRELQVRWPPSRTRTPSTT